MYNKIWEEGEIPNTWKHDTITPLLKEEKDPKDVRSYRPVALTNILCKKFERITNQRLVWYLEKKKKIDDRQFSFRKQRSTIDAKSRILKGFGRNAAVFID